jgi:hypothetical protein
MAHLHLNIILLQWSFFSFIQGLNSVDEEADPDEFVVDIGIGRIGLGSVLELLG